MTGRFDTPGHNRRISGTTTQYPLKPLARGEYERRERAKAAAKKRKLAKARAKGAGLQVDEALRVPARRLHPTLHLGSRPEEAHQGRAWNVGHQAGVG